MRLWHKDLIPVLPQQQLVGQWRECCLIAKHFAVDGTPNHLLVNKILLYPPGHFWKYGFIVMNEMVRRGYKVDFERFEQWIDKPYALIVPEEKDLFNNWHNDRYLRQCYYNLEEKFDCGGISAEEWLPIQQFYIERMLKK